jgi:hypothetical protein
MRHVIVIIVNDKDENFSKEEMKEMVDENMLEYIDNAPFVVESMVVESYT